MHTQRADANFHGTTSGERESDPQTYPICVLYKGFKEEILFFVIKCMLLWLRSRLLADSQGVTWISEQWKVCLSIVNGDIQSLGLVTIFHRGSDKST